MPLFVVLRDGDILTADLAARIKDTIRREISPRHVPDAVIAVPAIPMKRTGKDSKFPSNV